jgi:hypothetical protein
MLLALLLTALQLAQQLLPAVVPLHWLLGQQPELAYSKTPKHSSRWQPRVLLLEQPATAVDHVRL